MQKPTLSWIQQLGTTTTDSATSLATDAHGNIFIAGYTYGELVAGQKQGKGYVADAFLAKYNEAGKLLWMQQLGTSASDSATALATDLHGNVFIAGYTYGELVMGQKKSKHYAADAFLAKYSSHGTQLWMIQMGTPAEDRATALTSDHLGNVYVAGATGGELASGQKKGEALDIDAYLTKYSGDGILQWTIQLGSKASDSASALATDSKGNIYIAGLTAGELAPGKKSGDNQDVDAFLAKYSPKGTRRWMRQLGTPAADSATALATDAKGNIYLAGFTEGEMSPGHKNGGEINVDAYLAKYDHRGNRKWMRQLGTSAEDKAGALATGPEGNIYIAGYTVGELEPGQKSGIGQVPDAYLAKFNSKGVREWVQQLGTTTFDEATAVATDPIGNIYLAGKTFGELAPGQKKGAEFYRDAFLAKYVDEALVKMQQQKTKKHAKVKQEEPMLAGLDAALIRLAIESTNDAQLKLTKRKINKIIVLAADTNQKISDSRKKTLAYIYARFNLTRTAKEMILKALAE
ncbi:MAG: SBBP repeat-containing protein [Bacteroidota bacterium]